MTLKLGISTLHQKLFNSLQSTQRSNFTTPQIVQFRGKNIEEMSELTSNADSFKKNNEVTVISEQRSKNEIVRLYSDGSKDIITNMTNELSGTHYTELDKYDKHNNCYCSILEGENGIYKSALIDSKECIFKTESFIKENPEKTKATLTYKKTRNGIEVVEATVIQPDGQNYSLKKETDKYGFETGKYILSQKDKNGKQESQKVWAFEITAGDGKEKLEDTPWFKVKNRVFLTDIGLKGRIF